MTGLQFLLLALIALVMAVGAWFLWRLPELGIPDEATRSLGTSLISGAGISLAFFGLTQVTASHQQKIADQQTLRLRIGFQTIFPERISVVRISRTSISHERTSPAQT